MKLPDNSMLFRIGCDNMKIEKINDNQIRCTLTREDLENHQIRISELAYGTEKAKKLFRLPVLPGKKSRIPRKRSR